MCNTLLRPSSQLKIHDKCISYANIILFIASFKFFYYFGKAN